MNKSLTVSIFIAIYLFGSLVDVACGGSLSADFIRRYPSEDGQWYNVDWYSKLSYTDGVVYFKGGKDLKIELDEKIWKYSLEYACSNLERDKFCILIFGSKAGKHEQFLISMSEGCQFMVGSLSIDKLATAITRVFGLSKSGRYVIADVGYKMQQANGFSIRYKVSIIDCQRNVIIPNASVDQWAEFRSQ